MISSIRHVGLVVSNLERAEQFWCDTMGFKISRKMEECGPHLDAIMGLIDVKVTTVKLADSEGNLLELLCFSSHPDQDEWNGNPYSTGLTNIAFTVSDIKKTYETLKEKDVTFFSPPQFSPDGKVKVTYARGPEGIILELVEEL